MSKINNQGIGLVEAVLAIAFAVVLVVALLSLTTFNVQNSLNVTERQEATKNASNVLEKLRTIKDSNFDTFATIFNQNCTNTFCYFPNTTSNSSSFCPNPPKKGDTCFKVSTEPLSSLPIKEINVQVVSYYELNKILFSSSTETIFTNWRTKE
jgi:hypothetical protein